MIETTSPMASVVNSKEAQLASWKILLLWVLAGVSLLSFLSSRPVQRAQEARVLVTAREMLAGTGRQWLLPECNGHLRLQKPPLPYWYTALAYQLTGQDTEWAGRLPAVAFAWLSLGLAFLAGRYWFGQRAGLYGAGILLCSFLFFQYGRFAETDIPVTFFVSLSIVLAWLGMDLAATRQRKLATAGLLAGCGAAAGGAFMAKGLPGLFPVAFVLTYGISRRNWRGMGLAAVYGLVPMILTASPWYFYLYATGHWSAMRRELQVASEGIDHPGTVFTIIVEIFQASAPWVALWPVALAAAIRYRKTNSHLPGLLAWLFAVSFPLTLVGNKQIHYTMPLMVPLMLLCGWALGGALRGEFDELTRRTFRWLQGGLELILTISGIALVIWAVLLHRGVIAAHGNEELGTGMLVLGSILAMLGAAALMLHYRSGLAAGIWGTFLTLAVGFPVLFGPVSANIGQENIRDLTDGIIEHAGQGPMVVLGDESLPLTFALGRVVPGVKREALPDLATKDATVLVPTKPNAPVADLPVPWKMHFRAGPSGKHFQVFRVDGK